MTPASSQKTSDLWPRLRATVLGAFHRYANWLVGISWKRFFLLSVLLMIVTAITQSLPPFSYRVTETVDEPIRVPDLPELPALPELPRAPKAPQPPAPPTAPADTSGAGASKDEGALIQIEKPRTAAGQPEGLDISIDEHGIRIRPREAPQAPASATPATPGGPAAEAPGASAPAGGVTIPLPQSATGEIVREVVEEARQAVAEAVADARQAQREAARDAADAARDVADAARDATDAARGASQDVSQAAREAREAAREAIEQARRAIQEAGMAGATRKVTRTRVVNWGDFLTDLALIWIIASAIIKLVYKGRVQAEVKAAQATETAEAESLKRQVVEARMAAMQAQVEPHFLFNTLASIDHLIETDPPRASQMQKNLIALLRASMPTMREASGNGQGGGVRDLGRELAVIRPYLEILKVRMEERLTTEIDVPEGLHSAEFPPMMIQTLVENAIKHGLEPKPEGGSLKVRAEIVHGKLAVSVADTGLGFGRAATAGTGVGLANIRERLQLLYGSRAALTVTGNPGGGTVVTVTVPYRPVEAAMGAEGVHA
jgi:signal transduction histidine kinase